MLLTRVRNIKILHPRSTVSSLAEGVGENALGGGEKFTSRDCAKFGAAANFTPQKRDGLRKSLWDDANMTSTKF